LGVVGPLPKTAVLPVDATPVPKAEGTTLVPGATTPDGDGVVLLGVVGPLPNTAVTPVDATAAAGAVTALLDGPKFVLAAGETRSFETKLPAGPEMSLAARSIMPSPLKSAATTFLLSASIWESSIAGDCLVSVGLEVTGAPVGTRARTISGLVGGVEFVGGCAWLRTAIETVNKRRSGTRLIGISLRRGIARIVQHACL
jgi:hypothetical protein